MNIGWAGYPCIYSECALFTLPKLLLKIRCMRLGTCVSICFHVNHRLHLLCALVYQSIWQGLRHRITRLKC